MGEQGSAGKFARCPGASTGRGPGIPSLSPQPHCRLQLRRLGAAAGEAGAAEVGTDPPPRDAQEEPAPEAGCVMLAPEGTKRVCSDAVLLPGKAVLRWGVRAFQATVPAHCPSGLRGEFAGAHPSHRRSAAQGRSSSRGPPVETEGTSAKSQEQCAQSSTGKRAETSVLPHFAHAPPSI